jgi:hypothetical protein
MAQPGAIMLVERFEGQIAVRAIELDGEGRAVERLDGNRPDAETYLIVSGLAPRTLEPMHYQLRLVSAPS